MKTVFAALALIGGLALTGPVYAQSQDDRLQELLETFRQDYGFPGATAAIALADGSLVTAATGFADVEAGTPMSPETPMLAASTGKSFVAMTALALESDGRLSRSDLVSHYLGDRAWFDRLPNHTTMRVGDLMRHGAGLPDHVDLDAFQAEMSLRMASGGAAFTPEEAIAYVLDAEPLFPAGQGWNYTDTGYLLLGLVIEAASDQSYYNLVTERFLQPLALTSTRPSDRPDLPGLAVGYVAEDNPFGLPARTVDENGALLWDPSMEWTGGGFASTSRDLAVWGQALFSGTAMDTPYLDRLLDGAPVSPDAPGLFYGTGVAIYADTPRGPVYGHGGWIPGYSSNLRHYPDHGVTIAFQINTDVGIADNSTDLKPALEAALADLAIGFSDGL